MQKILSPNKEFKNAERDKKEIAAYTVNDPMITLDNGR
jgi:hypothetical protein